MGFRCVFEDFVEVEFVVKAEVEGYGLELGVGVV